MYLFIFNLFIRLFIYLCIYFVRSTNTTSSIWLTYICIIHTDMYIFIYVYYTFIYIVGRIVIGYIYCIVWLYIFIYLFIYNFTNSAIKYLQIFNTI